MSDTAAHSGAAAFPDSSEGARGPAVRPARRPDRRGPDRRTRPTPMLSRFTLFGGRRAGDRRDEAAVGGGATAATYVDVYEPWLAASLVAIGSLCALDAVFTLIYLQKGGSEANPLMDYLIGWGPQTFVIVKCGITNLGLLVLCLHKNFRHVKKVIGGLLFLYSALLLYHLYLAAVVV